MTAAVARCPWCGAYTDSDEVRMLRQRAREVARTWVQLRVMLLPLSESWPLIVEFDRAMFRLGEHLGALAHEA